MHRLVARRPSPAMVVALVALFISVGGSTYAALNLPRNSVGTSQLKKGAVTGAKLHGNSVSSSDVKDHSLRAADFKAGQLPAGPHGTTGQAGAQGPQGPAGPSTGAAGGDLTGSYPNPTIAAGAVDASKVGANSLTGAVIDESTLSQVPSAGAVGGENVITTTGFSNFIPSTTTSFTTTCPGDRLAVKGAVTSSDGLTVNSTSYGRSTFTANVTTTSAGAHFIDTTVTCFGGA